MDRWKEIEDLFHAGLAQPPDQRAKFLGDACPNDQELREEVLALLDRARDDSFLETSPVSTIDDRPPALEGQTLGNFKILGFIGRGGMGDVYRARDLKLHREVAIKVLPEALARDADRRARFQREAQAASALNHPNICTIYGFEEFVPHLAIVMELVEGTTLAARLAKGPVPFAQALTLAIQLADALDAAHSKGIVHRDLKPANLMLTKSGIMVLDFGLAKLVRPFGEGERSRTRSQQGTIFGTPQYMSPEQVLGAKVDSRSDIFSFGLVLYELLTGKPAFQAGSWSGLIGAILHTEPTPIRTAQPLVPVAIERAVTACLIKDPDSRFQSARDLKRALEWARESTDASHTDAPNSRPRRRAWIASVAAGCAIAATGWLWPRPPQEKKTPNWVAAIPTPGFTEVGAPNGPFISPDGSAILYRAHGAFWLRRSGTPEATALQWTTDIQSPFWSYDGEHLAYVSRRMLMKRRVPDGAEEKLADLPPGVGQRGGTWSQSGAIIVSHAGLLYSVDAGGGNPVALDLPNLKPGVLLWPEFLPNGEDFLFLWRPFFGDEESRIYLARLRKGRVVNGPRLLAKNSTAGHFAQPGNGQFLFVKNDELFAQRLDLLGWKLTGEPRLVLRGVGSAPAFHVPDFSVSRTGVLAWRPGTAALRQLTWFDRKGTRIGTSGEPGLHARLRLSNDEKQILSAAEDGTRVLESAGHGYRKVVFPYPIWNQDGSKLLYLETVSDHGMRALEEPSNGVGTVREIARIPPFSELVDVSLDGRFLLYLSSHGQLCYVLIDGGPSHGQSRLAVQMEGVFHGHFSPDGRWIVYATGSGEIYVQSFPVGRPSTLIASDGALFPVWRADGREIVFVRGKQVLAAQVEARGSEFRARPPETLFELRYPPPVVLRRDPLAISRDGSRILVIQPVDQPSSEVINVATAWDHN